MRRRIDLLDKHHTVTVYSRPGERRLQVGDGPPQPAVLTKGPEHQFTIQVGDQQADLKMAVKGDTAYIRAFDRTFRLRIVNPVEQAAQEAGGSSRALAPMPGTVVEVQVVPGETVSKGQPLLTIESMKILTVISAPRDGQVAEVHFEPGDTFDKSAALVTLRKEEDKQDAPNQVQC